MKKITFIILLTLVSVGVVSAQNGNCPENFRAKYNNISFASQKIVYNLSDQGANIDLDLYKSRFGFAFTTGRSYILHRRPIVRMIRIGIDATWFDINYANLKEIADRNSSPVHQLDIAMGVGPSVHVTPFSKLGVHAYFRYNPTFATFMDPTDGFSIAGGYSSVFVTGGAVSWGFISVGVEARWGGGMYHDFAGKDEEDEGPSKMKLKTKGMRAYVSFRF